MVRWVNQQHHSSGQHREAVDTLSVPACSLYQETDRANAASAFIATDVRLFLNFAVCFGLCLLIRLLLYSLYTLQQLLSKTTTSCNIRIW